MKKYLVQFIHRGALFGGFGPIILGIVFFIISKTVDGVTFSGQEVLLGVVSTYLLAFIHAGASIFNQIEHWSVAKSTLFHMLMLYLAYVTCYLINSWIAFDVRVVLFFTLIFIVIYAIVWATVVIFIKATEKKLNRKLNK